MPSIADLYVTVMPETSKIADGIERALRAADADVAAAARRWGREIEAGIGRTKIQVEADTAKAKAEIDLLTRDRHMTVHVNIDRDRLKADLGLALSGLAMGGFTNIAQMFSQSFSNVMQTQIVNNFSHITQNMGSVASSQGGSIGSQLGGSIMSALQPILMGGMITAAAGVAASLSGLVGLAPAGLMGAVSVVGTLATGLDGVADAWQAAGKAADSASKDQESKTKAMASAQRSLHDAVVEEANAQKDVANARRDARQQLEDLNIQLRGGVLDERSAILAAQAARRDLATGRFKDSIEYQEAQLRVEQADQRVLEAHERNVQLQNKAIETNAKGVDQSDQVVAANQRLVKAQEQVAAAQQAVADAAKPSSSVDAFAQAMGKLSPQAQAFITTLQGLKPAWDQLKMGVQDAFFAGLGPLLQQLATQYMPVLQTAMTGLAGTMSSAFKDIGSWLSQPETMAAIQAIIANIGSSFQIWSHSLVPFSQAFLTITQVGAGFLPQLGQMITDGANAFNKFITEAARSGELQQWMATGIDALRELMNMLPTLGKMFLDLAPIGVPVLRTIGQMLEWLEPLFEATGRYGLDFYVLLGKAASEFLPILNGLQQTFERVFNAISGVIERAWNAIKPVLDMIKNALHDLGLDRLLDTVQRFLPSLPSASPSAGVAPGSSQGVPFGPGFQLPTPSAASAPPASSSPVPASAQPGGYDWDKLALAESGGNWQIDTGNGYYGGLQFDLPTWKAYKPAGAPDNPARATREQQIEAGMNAIRARGGPQSLWPKNWQTLGSGSGATPAAPAVPSAPATAGVPATVPTVPSTATVPSTLPNVRGAHPQMASVLGMIQQLFPNAKLNAGKDDHGVDKGWHPRGQAIDIGAPGNDPQQLAAIANWLLQFAPSIEELIFQGPGITQNIKSGKLGPAIDMPGSVYNTGQAGYHGDHIHLAVTDQMGQALIAAMTGGGGNLSAPGYYPSAMASTFAAPNGISPDGRMPLGSQASPMYVQPASGAQQLGQDFLSGILEIFGIDGSVFKNPLGTPLFAGFKGIMSMLTGGGQGGGLPGAAWSAMGADGASLPGLDAVLGNSALAPLAGLITSNMPQPYNPKTVGGPALPPGAAAGKSAGDTHNVDQSIVFNGPVGNPQAAGDMATGFNVDRARQAIKAVGP